jgi:hypothetical protein
MKLKQVIAISLLTAIVSVCQAQQKSNIQQVDFDKKLPIYNLRSCIKEFFTAVTKSNSKFYDPKKYFYSVTITKGEKRNYLGIEVDRWNSARKIDYYAVVRLSSGTLLLRGDTAIDSLFTKKNSKDIEIKLKKNRNLEETTPYTVEPILQGILNTCGGKPLSVEVYTKGKIKGFEMKQ